MTVSPTARLEAIPVVEHLSNSKVEDAHRMHTRMHTPAIAMLGEVDPGLCVHRQSGS